MHKLLSIIIALTLCAYYEPDGTTVYINDVISGLKNMDSYYNDADYEYPTISMSTLLDMLDDYYTRKFISY